MSLTVAIVGRPNVGKSTLFNKLAGRKLALVHDTPGVTRDRREAETTLGTLTLRIIDTAGVADGAKDSLAARMTAQTMTAAAGADVCLFLIDGREGVTAADEIVAQALRPLGKPVVLAVNKCEGRQTHLGEGEGWSLGFGEPIAISAEHRLGLEELSEALAAFAGTEEEPAEAEPPPGDKPLRLAIIGRPNVGKSSIFNRLIGSERALTGPEAGITRDAVAARWHTEGREILLHDTAGLRKKARAAGHALEEMSVGSTLEAVRFADCAIVVMDATMAFEKQDLTIADLIAREGRAVVFAANKWDLVEKRAGAVGRLRDKLDRLLPQLAGAPLIGVSALTGEGMDRLLPSVLAADRAWNTRVPTATLNRFLEEALTRHAPPAIHGRRVRIRYMTQLKSRPPTFALFGTQLKALPEAYLRYLANGLRQAFHLEGAPLRFVLRTAKNPYAD
ncbi:MAG: ribosome biogenesis GTPase Der [Alphaproteobacteria bacterium]|nr:ribosome biogenesis GTPase Der [Alphaproteobacteria bacterium]